MILDDLGRPNVIMGAHKRQTEEELTTDEKRLI